ncbi:thiamine transporter [Acholeplasma morum]|uniref:energy-coupled thiamine transporter ThiT n=1 Tax=Paracholeplasma morum TaxID=264637 RepID=UPI00195D056F|nr:energy-coupled thiamine transporter ThiT [Paracholeplasma morum]MBM7453602.1 thiamine transporter [Paracholeplasma morum]
MKLKKDAVKMLLAVNLLALAIVLDVITSAIPGLNLSMPFGGKFFGISMLPLVMIGLFAGLKYGLISGFLYALYNFGIDYLVYIDALRATLESWTGESWTFGMIVMLVLFDYIIPFTAYGLSGLFKDGFTKLSKMIIAIITVSVVRLVSSTLSGVILWSSSIKYASEEYQNGTGSDNIAVRIFAGVGENLWVYSLTYNFIYIFTTTLVVILLSVLSFKRLKDLSIQFLYQ